MKFDKVEPKEKWSAQRVYHRIALVKGDIANTNRLLNRNKGAMGKLLAEKQVLVRKITNKWRYLRQLNAQLAEIKGEARSVVSQACK